MKYFAVVFVMLTLLNAGLARADLNPPYPPDSPTLNEVQNELQNSASLGHIVLRCQSWGGQFNYCNAGGPVASAHLRYQFAGPRCIQGYNWNYDYRGVWVTGGCSADFTVFFQGYNPPPPPHQFYDVSCSSNSDAYTECGTPIHPIAQAQLINQYSHAACIFGHSWGVRHNRIWVNKGCRGLFRVWGY